MSDMKQQILACARELIQRRGYNGFSYRDVALEVGIRAASIHHHFPAKADLAIAVIRSYTDVLKNEAAKLEARAATPEEKIRWLVGFFKATLSDDNKMCLCGMLGAEANSLPAEVNEETATFFRTCLGWLTDALGSGAAAERRARHFLASLEGALILAKTLNDADVLDTVSASALQDILGTQD